MSYTRKYDKRIAVPYRGTVNYRYEPSQTGGVATVHYDGTVYEDIHIEIEVDTRPFDRSVAVCNTSVDLLTGSVVATEAAQVASIQHNSEKVAGTIVSGFFSYIKSEISQQIAELSQNMDAQIMHLRELSKACIDKKRQMNVDFERIAGRYIKIFDDLNSELHNRVHELDKPTFQFKKELSHQQTRCMENDLVNVVSIAGKEGSQLVSKMSVSVAKKRAYDTINQMKSFLWQQKKLNATIQSSKINDSVETRHFTPVCFVEMKEMNSQITKNIYTPDYIQHLNENYNKSQIIENLSDNHAIWSKLDNENAEQIKVHFNKNLNQNYTELDTHTTRVRKMILQLADINQIASNNY